MVRVMVMVMARVRVMVVQASLYSLYSVCCDPLRILRAAFPGINWKKLTRGWHFYFYVISPQKVYSATFAPKIHAIYICYITYSMHGKYIPSTIPFYGGKH